MNANHETTPEMLGDLSSAVKTVEAKQQALDDAIDSRNKIILAAFRAGIPAQDIAERMGVLKADVELLMSAELVRSGRVFTSSRNGTDRRRPPLTTSK